jgi:signal transduction histidine kinase
MENISRILLIEDDDIDARNIIRTIKSGIGDHVVIEWVTDSEMGRKEILRNIYDVCLVDYKLGADDGVELIRLAVNFGCKMPLILLTGMSTGVVDIVAMEGGASDYLVKGDLTPAVLTKSIGYAVARQKIHNSLVEAKELLSIKNKELLELNKTAHEFVDNVSHEFRTPLTVIKEFSSILREGLSGEVNDEQIRYLDIIQDRTSDLSVMIDDMLDVSRMEAGLLGISRVKVTVGEVFDRIQQTLTRKATSSEVEISIAIEDPSTVVLCDPENIARVIGNLGFNAIKFSGRDGVVNIRTEMSVDKSHVTFYVTDNGPGISQKDMNVIFDRFEQVGSNTRASTKGFGLGLNIATELVRLNLGKLNVQSDFGSGSSFYFSIPVYETKTIISDYANSIMSSLNSTHYVVIFDVKAKNSIDERQNEALESFLQRQLRRHDLLLPNGVDGWILCAQLSPLDIGGFAKRYFDAITALNNDVMNEDLADFSFDKRGFWNLQTEKNDFIKEFLMDETQAA